LELVKVVVCGEELWLKDEIFWMNLCWVVFG